MEHEKNSNRRAYLMRLWRENTNASWRVMLQEVGSNEQIKFASWEALQGHLANLMQKNGRSQIS